MVDNILNNLGSVFLGRTTVQMRGEIGGTRSVFVPYQGIKNDLIFPTTGGIVKNPFKTSGKMYAGDLVEFRFNGNGVANKYEQAEVILMKTFEVQANISGTTLFIVRDGFRHKPEVGNVIMKAPDTLTGTGLAVTVNAVEATKNKNVNVWKLTLSDTIAGVVKGDIMVEAAEAGADKGMLVQNPNAMLPCDYDFKYPPAVSADDYDNARYYMTPALHGTAFEILMSPLPKAVKAINKSRIEGYFQI